jgi:hypothetical protein
MPLRSRLVLAGRAGARKAFVFGTPLLLSLLTFACGSGPDQSEGFAVRDSAGVIIAENSPGSLEGAPPLLRGEPVLDIGLVEGDSAYQLFRVRGGRRLSDGSVAILNAGTQEVRLFGPEGVHRATFGRQGDGPGEFREPFGLWVLPGDSLVVFDQTLQRISVFTSAGELIRVAQTERRALNANMLTVLDDGSFITFDEFLDIPDEGFAPIYMHLVRWSADGVFIDSLGPQIYAEMGAIGEAEARLVGGRTFSPRTSTTGNDEAYWVGTGTDPDVTMYGPDGRMLRRVRWNAPDRTVRPEHIEAYRQDRLEGVDPARQAVVEQRLRTVPVVDVFPAYQWIFATRDGFLWVCDYIRPGVDSARWFVFDADGRLMGHLETSPRFFPFDGGRDWVLAVEPDEFDVEHVRLYQLSRD